MYVSACLSITCLCVRVHVRRSAVTRFQTQRLHIEAAPHFRATPTRPSPERRRVPQELARAAYTAVACNSIRSGAHTFGASTRLTTTPS